MNICYKLHELFSRMQTYDFNTINQIPFDRGIYVFLDNSEKYKGFKRIVRVGTHGTSFDNNGLKNRLNYHFKGNRKCSIFRKNVGRAIIIKNNYGAEILNFWNSKKSDYYKKLKNYDLLLEQKTKIEQDVSKYIRSLKFVVIPLENYFDRDRFETGIISSICQCDDFKASNDWLGNFVPNSSSTKIKNNRIWCSDKSNDRPLSKDEYEKLYNICERYFICTNS